MSKIIVDQLNATEAFKVPTFTEAQRDALTNVQEGFLIHNSTAEQMEIIILVIGEIQVIKLLQEVVLLQLLEVL